MTTTSNAKTSNAKQQSPGDDQSGPTGLQHPKMVRRLQVLVVILGIVLLAGLVAVAARIAYLVLEAPGETATTQPVSHTPAPAAPPAATAITGTGQSDIELPSGAVIENIASSTGTLAIQYRTPTGQEIVIINTATGQIVRRLRIKAEDK